MGRESPKSHRVTALWPAARHARISDPFHRSAIAGQCRVFNFHPRAVTHCLEVVVADIRGVRAPSHCRIRRTPPAVRHTLHSSFEARGYRSRVEAGKPQNHAYVQYTRADDHKAQRHNTRQHPASYRFSATRRGKRFEPRVCPATGRRL
jgi:hypothetical protein